MDNPGSLTESSPEMSGGLLPTLTPSLTPLSLESSISNQSTTRRMLPGTDISKVLILYSGGTIGMKWTEEAGYVPAAGWLFQRLARMPNFHDADFVAEFVGSSPDAYASSPEELLECDNALSSVERSPSRPRRISSIRGNGPKAQMDLDVRYLYQPGLSVDDPLSSPSSGRGSMYPLGRIQLASHHRALSPFLVTPLSGFRKRTAYQILEYAPLIDSANMRVEDWVRLARDVHAFYPHYDAFIILHGSDTMAYSASALSFMLQDLGKSVILTGSQIPLSEVRNDAADNLMGALTIAGHFIIPEVGLYFGHKLYRGNRVTKISAVDFHAFDSPNAKPLVEMGIHINVAWSDVFRPWSLKPMSVQLKMSPNIATYRFFPGIALASLDALLQPPIQAVILETFGSGNAPSNRADVLAALARAASPEGGNIVIVNISQCRKGGVAEGDRYATGRQLLAAGVIPGRDLTMEAAIAKLSYLFGLGLSPDQVRVKMTESLRGELSIPPVRPTFSLPNHSQGDLQIMSESADGLTRAAATLPALIKSLAMRPLQASSEKDVFDTSLATDLLPIFLLHACVSGDLQLLLQLIEMQSNGMASHSATGPDANTVLFGSIDPAGRTLLHVASELGHLHIVHYLLLQGLSVHARDKSSQTALHKAFNQMKLDVADLLIQTGARLQPEDAFFGELLRQAIREDDCLLLSRLVEATGSPSAIYNFVNDPDVLLLHQLAACPQAVALIEYVHDALEAQTSPPSRLSLAKVTSVKDDWGHTAMQIAEHYRNECFLSIFSDDAAIAGH